MSVRDYFRSYNCFENDDGLLRDYHTHTCFSDGRDTPEDMIEAAVRMGMAGIGISDHYFAEYDTDCCIPRNRLSEYRETVLELKERYAGSIAVHCGIEQDYFSEQPDAGYDYVIGSVHYIMHEGEYLCVDYSPEVFTGWVERCFGGDYYEAAEIYYDLVGDIVERTDCDIIGHFNLFAKFNEGGRLFDEENVRYTAAWQKAADRLSGYDRLFEINTGAVMGGWRSAPYPTESMIQYIRSRKGRFIRSSDTHSAGGLCFGFNSIF